MSKSRDALGVVLTGLRDLIATGAMAPGATVSIVDVAERYRVSVTPVREALARLVGEGLLKAVRRSGYERPRLEAEDLDQLYSLREALLLGANRQRRTSDSLGGAPDDLSPAQIFAGIVASARNAPLARAYTVTALLLAPAVRAEAGVFDDWDREAQELRAAYAARPAGRLEFLLIAYHDRRRAAATRLAQYCGSATPATSRAQELAGR